MLKIPVLPISHADAQPLLASLEGPVALIARGAPLPITALGSGSDYTAFIDHLGIASLNLGYGGESETDGVYHSAYDSFEQWFRHMIYAPGLQAGYGAKTLPGVREAIEDRRWPEAERYAAIIGDVLNACCDRLDQATALLRGQWPWTLSKLGPLTRSRRERGK